MANGQLNGTELGVYIAGTLVAYSYQCDNQYQSQSSFYNKQRI